MAAIETIELAGSSLAIVPETTYGTTPSTPAFQTLRLATEDLQMVKTTEPDPEVTAYAAETDQVDLGHEATGTIQASFYFDGAHQTLMAHALRSTWADDTPEAGTDRLVNGVGRYGFTAERKLVLPAASAIYHRFTGCRATGFEYSVQARQRATFSVPVLGLTETKATSAIAGATYAAGSSVRAMSGKDAGAVTIGSLTGDIYLQSLTARYGTAAQTLSGVGQAAALGVTYGPRSAELQMALFYGADSAGAFDLFTAGTPIAISHTMTDPAGNLLTITYPRVFFTAQTGPAIRGNQGEVMLELTAKANVDRSTGKFMQIDRTPA
jgi:hypothetical protein